MRQIVSVGCVLSLTFLGGCERFFSGDVATGVARLTVRNLGAIALLVNDDTRCGFSSPAALESATVEGQVGGYGRVTQVVENCAIEVKRKPAAAVTAESGACDAVSGEPAGDEMRGRITVTARRTVEGRLTGDVNTPVVPASPDAAIIELDEVEFANFMARPGPGKPYLVMKTGSISASIKPRLAAEPEYGACAEVTSDVSFERVRYHDAKLYLWTPDREFDVDVPSSDFAAQSGKSGGRENYLAGSVKVWDDTEAVPADGSPSLDPDYRASSDVVCGRPRYACGIDQVLAQHGARSAVATLAVLAMIVHDDTTCGFSSPNAYDGTTTWGRLGDDGGTAQVTLRRPCVLDYLTATRVSGARPRIVQGRAVIEGSKELRGYITGNRKKPVVPTSRDAADLRLTATLENFMVKAEAGWSMTVLQGRLSGVVSPRLALDLAVGACSSPTPVVTFRDVELRDAVVRVSQGGKSFDLNIPYALVHGQNGLKDGAENTFDGEIVFEGKNYRIPEDTGDPQLDPSYRVGELNPDIYNSEVWLPDDDEACSLRGVLAQNAARLAIKSLGALTTLTEEDTACGFQSPAGLVPGSVTRTEDGRSSVNWQVRGCGLHGNGDLWSDLGGGAGSYYVGDAHVRGHKVVRGRVVAKNPPVEPVGDDSVSFDFGAIELSGFEVYDVLADGSYGPSMHIRRGQLRGIVEPVMAPNPQKPHVYDVVTDDVAFSAVALDEADVVLRFEGMTFNARLDSMWLNAFKGSYGGRDNELIGSVRLDGRDFELPTMSKDPGLEPRLP